MSAIRVHTKGRNKIKGTRKRDIDKVHNIPFGAMLKSYLAYLF